MDQTSNEPKISESPEIIVQIEESEENIEEPLPNYNNVMDQLLKDNQEITIKHSQSQIIEEHPDNNTQDISKKIEKAKNFEQKYEIFNDFRQNSYISELPAKNNEVHSQYQNRKIVYENVMNDIKDHDKAICYSNIWVNMKYLGVRYTKNLEEIVMKYDPSN